jgi:dipeptidyl aminopeptidase/acylaminoacyl peptidase
MRPDEGARGLVPEDLVSFAWLEGVALSPDGARVAATVRRVDAERNGYHVDAYLYEVDEARRQRLTRGRGQASSLAWSRDASRLAFVWQGDDGTSIVVVGRDGTPSQRVSVEGPPPSALDWSPDGRQLACVRTTTIPDPPAARDPALPAPTLRVVRRLRYKQDGAGWVADRFRQIWTLDLTTGTWDRRTSAQCDHSQPRWSWDGRTIAYVVTAREQDLALGYGQIALHDLATGESRPLLHDWPGASSSPQWRRDDGAIAFAGHRHPAPVNRRGLFGVYLAELGESDARGLTDDIDQTVGNYAFSDQRPGLTNVTVKWPGGDGPISFLLTERGAVHLYEVAPTGAASARPIVAEDAVVFEYDPAPGGRVAIGMASQLEVGDLYLVDGDRSRRRLTELNPWIASRRLAWPESGSYAGLGGADVHTWLVRPLDLAPGKRAPAVVYVHCSMFSYDFSLEVQCLAAAGYVVSYSNARGTTAGYGQASAFGSYYGKQEEEFAELMLGVDRLVELPFVDPERLGVTGGSCGGFMTNWIVTHTDRFKAAVTQRSISDLVSKFGTSDNGPEQALSEGAGPPWLDVETLWRNSPIAYAERVTTPLLILHAAEDHRCTIEQAEELFAALRWLGKRVELVVFEGESHGLSRSGRPGNRIEHLRRLMGWFDEHLEG